ncbi:MAG: hypothetical protein HQL15_04355 [Candidatus Omnitrophica bacterium]|nr:hypothetical protein [Candidatus Omnitrophota bacterium]
MRYFFISFLIHLLLLSFVWVGFSVSAGRSQNSFTYLGHLVTETGESFQKEALTQQSRVSDRMLFEESSTADSSPWLKLREMNKPR